MGVHPLVVAAAAQAPRMPTYATLLTHSVVTRDGVWYVERLVLSIRVLGNDSISLFHVRGHKLDLSFLRVPNEHHANTRDARKQ